MTQSSARVCTNHARHSRTFKLATCALIILGVTLSTFVPQSDFGSDVKDHRIFAVHERSTTKNSKPSSTRTAPGTARIGVCLHGEMRSFDEDIADALRRNIIKPLQQVGEVDVFVATTGRTPEDVAHAESLLQKMSAPLLLTAFRVELEKKLPLHSEILDRWFHRYGGGGRGDEVQQLAQQWYGWQRCGEMVREHELAGTENWQYQLLVKSRLDIFPLSPILSSDDLYALMEVPAEARSNMVMVPTFENYGGFYFPCDSLCLLIIAFMQGRFALK